MREDRPDVESRRIAELRQLADEGVEVIEISRWHYRVAGCLHIWPAAGRWLQDQTKARGKLRGRTMRDLLRAAVPDKASAAGAGR